MNRPSGLNRGGAAVGRQLARLEQLAGRQRDRLEKRRRRRARSAADVAVQRRDVVAALPRVVRRVERPRRAPARRHATAPIGARQREQHANASDRAAVRVEPVTRRVHG